MTLDTKLQMGGADLYLKQSIWKDGNNCKILHNIVAAIQAKEVDTVTSTPKSIPSQDCRNRDVLIIHLKEVTLAGNWEVLFSKSGIE